MDYAHLFVQLLLHLLQAYAFVCSMLVQNLCKPAVNKEASLIKTSTESFLYGAEGPLKSAMGALVKTGTASACCSSFLLNAS